MSVRNNLPLCPSSSVASASSNVRVYEITVITPLFGGGVSTRVNDSSFPIRSTSIRGQLQFWWRATVGAQYATKLELRKAQSAIWGDTSQASRVQVRVDGVQADEPKPCARFETDHKNPGKFRSMPTWNDPFQNSTLPYALFPFQGQLANTRQQIDVEPASCIHNAKFRLSITCSKGINFATQVEPAIWAWVNFGGLGSRTRRGCGSLFCKTLAPQNVDELNKAWQQFMPDLFPQREWPTMAGTILTDRDHAMATSAWDRVIDRFRHFRQGLGMGRNHGQLHNRPGRSRYPEPEAIRTVLWDEKKPWSHDRLEHIPNDAFPRAELGLPIVFHFQGQDEPPDTVLYPNKNSVGENRERMASPLILKPLVLHNGKSVPLILRLQTAALTGVDLRHGETSLNLPPTTQISDPRLANYTDSPLRASPSGSAIEAFLALARTEGFTEVTR